jgi:putative PIN family toxin of toxin-antitoxin system
LRIVFDTNVYISAFALPDSKSSFAFDLVVSPDIIAELLSKLAEPTFGFSQADLGDAEGGIREIAAVVEPELRISAVEDEPDNRILECAVAARASAIVTGDRHLLALKSYQGIGIMTVSDLLYTFPETS